jgi:hypothetical protein
VFGTSDARLLEELGTIKVEIYPISKIISQDPNYTHKIEMKTVYNSIDVHPLKGHAAQF